MACDFILDSDERGEFCVISLKCKYGDYFVKIDVQDFEDISQYNWRLWWRKGYDKRYVVRNLPRKNGRRSTVKMHRQIMGVRNPEILMDHEDGDGLNNRRYNLRVANVSQNQWNQEPRKAGTSKYKGVCWNKGHGRWSVSIGYEGKQVYVGDFAKEIIGGVDVGEIAAAKAYDKAARKYFGSFACLNFPEETITMYEISEKDKKKALTLIGECKGTTIGDTSGILSNIPVAELEIMCKYFECNISRLAGRIQGFTVVAGAKAKKIREMESDTKVMESIYAKAKK